MPPGGITRDCTVEHPAKLWLFPEQITNRLFHDLASHLRYGASQRNVLGADLDAVLRITALLDAAIAHEGCQPLTLERLACGMCIEELNLRDGGGAHETGGFVELRTSLHAATTRNAARQRIGHLLLFHAQARAGAKIIRAIYWHPCLHQPQVFEKNAAVDCEVADYGKF